MRLLLRALLSVLLAASLAARAAATPGPEHLTPVLEALGAAGIPVLVPPERPPGTTATVAEADDHFYRLLFTNDPEGTLAHAEQVNVIITGRDGPLEPPPEAIRVEVRGTEGAFSCGASACFLDWEEGGVAYSIGEFGGPEDAAAFAGSLVALDDLPAGDADPPPGPPARNGPPAAVVALLAGIALALVTGMVLARRARRR